MSATLNILLQVELMVDFGCWSNAWPGLIVFAGFAGLGVLFAWGKKNTIAAIVAGTIGLILYLTFLFC